MWGQLMPDTRRGADARNTPTYVGTTCGQPPTPAPGKEHPHVCGDNTSYALSYHLQLGTPPRMWGQRRNTFSASPTASEHPHVCGDNNGVIPGRGYWRGTPPRMWGQLTLLGSGGLGLGTPPRMWGQLTRALRLQGANRNTPTYVGTTAGFHRRGSGAAEHPHVCGDNVGAPENPARPSGTPPRMWGQLQPSNLSNLLLRNTPTYVGTTRLENENPCYC